MIIAGFVSFFFFLVLFVLSWGLGGYVLGVMEGQKVLMRILRPVEWVVQKGITKVSSIEMNYKEYLLALLSFMLVTLFCLYTLFRLQPVIVSLFCSTEGPALPPHIAFNLATSFMTNTDWQCASPESTLHPLIKTIGLIPHMFLSPAVGLACFCVVLRGIAGERVSAGNFFRDVTRALVYVLLPLTLLGTVLLRILGVEQGFFLYGKESVAFFEAIKQIGSNGAGYWAANSAGIRENPSAWTTLVEWACMLLLPMGALRMISEKLGVRLFGVRVGLLFCCVLACLVAYVQYNESHSFILLEQSKETLGTKPIQVGSFFSSLWSISTTATSCGSTVCALADLTSGSKIALLALMHTGETVFGGVGVGAISILFMQIFAMFSAGLLVGRTPELFGKKIDAGTMKLSLLAVLLPVFLIYMTLWAQIAFGLGELPSTPERTMTPLIYAVTSVSVNNGSQMAGMDYTHAGMAFGHSVLMLLSRCVILMLAVLLAEHLSEQKIHPRTEGSIRIESWTSVIWLMFVVFSSSILCFCSLWVLGPCMERYLLKI